VLPNPTLGYSHEPVTEHGFQETLLKLARDARQRGRHELAALAAEDGLRSPSYQTEFLEELSISGYYSALPGHRNKAADACERLLHSRQTPEQNRRLAYHNSQYYAPSLHEKGLGRSFRLDFPVQEGYALMNTSLAWAGEELWAVVRAVNYRWVNEQFVRPPGQPLKTLNYLVRLSSEGQVLEQVTLQQPPPGRPDPWALGPEDLRLFVWQRRFFATATVLDQSPNHRCQMALMEFERSGKLLSFCLLGEPQPLVNQKNWMPLVDGNRVLLLVNAEPTLWAELQPDSGALQFVSQPQPEPPLAEVRGGSQWVRWKRKGEEPGWLAVVHNVFDQPDQQRVYLHRFLWMNANGQLSQLSRPFHFFESPIEYCSGLSRGFTSDTFWLGVGRYDCESHIVELTDPEIQSLFDLPQERNPHGTHPEA
jgi:hypothetical protein